MILQSGAKQLHLPHSSEFGEKVRGQWEECFGTATTCTKAQAWRGFLFVSLFAVWLREHTSDVADDNAGASDEEEEADVDEEEDVDQDVLEGESMAEAYLRRHDPELEAYLADNGIDIVEFEDDSAGEQVELINQNADIFYKTRSLPLSPPCHLLLRRCTNTLPWTQAGSWRILPVIGIQRQSS